LFGVKKVQELQKTLADEQQRRQQVHEEQIKKEERLKQYAFVAGLAITLLIAFILYRNNLQKQKSNVLLQHEKEKVETTLQELKSTQAQLIQSEKMASLGELTAGIAHEIQNPLNFVNNFSQINAELLDEAEVAIKGGKPTEAIELISNLRTNEVKITEHGQRADAIVKSMMLHSRSGPGQKERTNINALVQEYARLSYQGQRSKDKILDITLNLDLDEKLEEVEIVPQDIGRVLLNLFNNAFYTVAEKKKLNIPGYMPAVFVSTKKTDKKLLITVRDNGQGIPSKIKGKIFQPFFTTKPTGQGTGLGLSLSHDIIKVHGGLISVESEEGTGTEFIVELPG
jgi:two-component system, NtrC family, sensor kinase